MALPDNPITRKETYLAKIAGQEVQIPDVPITREEAYLDEIAKNGGGGGGYVLPTATANRLGGVKIGSGINVEEDGTISASGGGGGTDDYNDLDNQPQINGVTLSGNKTTSDLGITASDVGAIPSTDKGANGGVAELDSNGKVPSSQLPSYVDDVLSYASQSAFPATGETGKIYIAEDTNKTYRWSGSAYAEISASLALGETSSTAYRGDRGKTAYDHSQTTGNPHGTTFSDLSNKPENANTFQGTIAKWNQLTTAEQKAYDHASIPDSIDGGVTFPADKVIMTGGGNVEDDLASAVPRMASGTTIAQLVSALNQLSEDQKNRCVVAITSSQNTVLVRRVYNDFYTGILTTIVGTNKYIYTLQATRTDPVYFYVEISTSAVTTLTITSWTLYYQGTPIS